MRISPGERGSAHGEWVGVVFLGSRGLREAVRSVTLPGVGGATGLGGGAMGTPGGLASVGLGSQSGA